MKKLLGAFSMMMSASAALAQGSPDVIPLGSISKSYLSCSMHHNCVVADQSAIASKIRSTPNGHPIGTIQNKVAAWATSLSSHQTGANAYFILSRRSACTIAAKSPSAPSRYPH
jgi:hypothetical protein